MARPVPPEAWASILQQAGPEQAAQWARESGYDAPELPPLDPEEEDVFAGSAPTSPLGALSQTQQGGLDALLDRRRKSIADMYDAAAKQLQESYRGPSTNDMLLALGAGLLQPTSSGSFAEALGQGLQSMLPYLKEKHGYQNDLNRELARMQMGKARDLGDLEEKYLVAQIKAEPGGQKVRAMSDPVGKRFNAYTGFDLPTPDRIDFLLKNANDPAVRAAFDAQYGPQSAASYITQYGGQ